MPETSSKAMSCNATLAGFFLLAPSTVEESLPSSISDYRKKWVNAGCPWFWPEYRPLNWSFECASPLGWTTFYRKIGVKAFELLYLMVFRLQVPK